MIFSATTVGKAGRSSVKRHPIPLDRVSNAKDTANKHLREHATAPIGAERGLQPWRHFIHAVTRCELASDRKPRISHCQNASSCADEVDSTEKDICSPKGWISFHSKLCHARGPCLGIEQRHLSTPAPIDIARDTLSRD